MEKKSKITAEDGRLDLTITRTFDLPVDLLFKAYSDPAIIAQWMGTKVLKLENRTHGSWQFETTDAQGNVVFAAGGVIHEFSPDRKIIRTFEMENASFGVQLEFIEFEPLSDDTSRLRIHVIYRTAEARDQQLRLPFAYGLNMAHDRLQEVAGKLNLSAHAEEN